MSSVSNSGAIRMSPARIQKEEKGRKIREGR
jgi:hypothetical protein